MDHRPCTVELTRLAKILVVFMLCMVYILCSVSLLSLKKKEVIILEEYTTYDIRVVRWLYEGEYKEFPVLQTGEDKIIYSWLRKHHKVVLDYSGNMDH